MSEIRNKQVVVRGALPNQNQVTVKKSKKARKPRIRNRGGNPTGLSMCAAEFAMAATDPFGFRLSNRTVCIPDLNDQPSFKFSTIYRGTFSTGTLGFGFVAVNPARNYRSSNQIITHSGGAYSGGTIGNGVGIIQVLNSRFPFDDDTTKCRLVTCGLRVRYSGTEINRGGSILPYCDGTNSNLQSTSFDMLASNPSSVIYPCSRKWVGTNWRTLSSVGREYATDGIPAILPMACVISAPAGVAQTYDYEFVAYYEAIPVQLQTSSFFPPGVTASHSDVSGYSRVRDFLGTVSNSEIGVSLWNKAKAYLTRTASNMILPGSGDAVLLLEGSLARQGII